MDNSSMPKGVGIKGPVSQNAQRVKTDPLAIPANKGAITAELNGRLIRVVKVDGLKGYLNYRSADSGHIIFTRRDADGILEFHVLIIQGKPVAAYSEASPDCGSALIEALLDVPGAVEYYFIEEHVIRSLLDKYPQVATGDETASRPAMPMDKKAAGEIAQDWQTAPRVLKTVTPVADRAPEKPTKSADRAIQSKPYAVRNTGGDIAMGEKVDRHAYSVDDDPHAHAAQPVKLKPVEPEAILRTAESEENDLIYMKNVEEEFESNVDVLLKRLKLTHLASEDRKKK